MKNKKWLVYGAVMLALCLLPQLDVISGRGTALFALGGIGVLAFVFYS